MKWPDCVTIVLQLKKPLMSMLPFFITAGLWQGHYVAKQAAKQRDGEQKPSIKNLSGARQAEFDDQHCSIHILAHISNP